MSRPAAPDDVTPVLQAARRLLHTPSTGSSSGENADHELARLALDVDDLRTTVSRLHRAIVDAEDDLS